MRLRVEPASARKQLAAEIVRLGGLARAVGTSLDLSYPPAELADHDQERTELTFFVRAWLAAEIGVQAEVLPDRRLRFL
jgi:hypothetical protein